MKKILIISNNPLSYSQPNSKTILSLLGNDSEFTLAQIYFKDDTPSYKNCIYYSITDKDIYRSFIDRKYLAGSPTNAVNDASFKAYKKTSISQNKYFLRLLRELIWKFGKVDYSRLFEWINNFEPDLIFFMGGDCAFSYDLVKRIKCHTPNTKLVIYITDDYILPRKSLSLAFWIRRSMLLKRMRSCIPKADLFITISEKMRDTYLKMFGKNSIVYANSPDEIKSSNDSSTKQVEDRLIFVYAGGLHYNRWKMLAKLASAIYQYNVANEHKAVLHIYTNTKPSKRILRYIIVDGASEYLGALDSNEILTILLESNVNVHVESFDNKSIDATRLSFSTKIYEYMSLENCILAIGPPNIASMEYLSNCAYCVNEIEDINKSLIEKLDDEKLRKSIADKCYAKYVDERVNRSAKVEIKKRLID